MNEDRVCFHCEVDRVYAKGLCKACYTYLHKEGYLPSARTLARRLRRKERDRLEGLAEKQGMTCAVEGCGRPVRTRSWCSRHYSSLLRYGDPDAPLLRDDEPLLPNPWVNVAPACPQGHEPLDVYLWASAPEDGLGKWFCAPCGKRFSEAAALRRAS